MKAYNLLIAVVSLLPTCAFSDSVPLNSEKSKFELANVVRGLLVDKGSSGTQYLDLKKLVRNLHYFTNDENAKAGSTFFPGDYNRYGKIYRGEIALFVNGKRFLGENMEDQYSWIVYVAGPNAAPSTLYITSDKTVAASGGPSYFRKAGLTLQPIACSSVSGGNYDGYFIVSAPGKRSAILQIRESSGSGGSWYSYGLFWDGLLTNDLPKDMEVGDCAIND